MTKTIQTRFLRVTPWVLCALLGACTTPQRSTDELARERLAEVPGAPDRETRSVAHEPPQADPSVAAYTWQRRAGAAGEELVVYGRGLAGASALRLGDRVLEVRVERDGRRLVALYPKDVEGSVPLRIELGERLLEVPEPFSTLKPDGLPQIQSYSFARERVTVPERVEGIGGRDVEAVRFELAVEGYEPRNAPVTLFVGGHAVPNDQIQDEPGRIVGWIYLVRDLREGEPVTIDFGHGLRVLVVEAYSAPR